jgi:hypothetical protein
VQRGGVIGVSKASWQRWRNNVSMLSANGDGNLAEPAKMAANHQLKWRGISESVMYQ